MAFWPGAKCNVCSDAILIFCFVSEGEILPDYDDLNFCLNLSVSYDKMSITYA